MKPYIDILKLVWPLALGMINNAAMQFADRAYLARLSQDALDAVLPSGVLAWIFMGFFQSVIGYSGVFISQYHGSGDAMRCRDCYRVAMRLSLVSGLLLFALVPVGNWIIACTAPSAVVLDMEREYYDIVVCGGIFVCIQMAATSYFTGRGRTRIVFWVNLAGNLLNIVLDPLLIFGWCGFPRLGIAGAAIATVAAAATQFVTLAWFAHADCHSREPRIAPVCSRSDPHAASDSDGLVNLTLRILRFGVPAGCYEFLSMASFSIFIFVTEGVGERELAVSNACFTINYLLFAPMMGFAIGAQTLVGQARGRGDEAGAVLALRRTLILGLAFVALALMVTLVFNRPILALFAPDGTGAAADFHSLGVTLLIFMAVWMLFDAADVIYSGALKGAGDTKFVMWWMLVVAFGLWLPLVFAVRHFSNTMPMLWLTMIVYVLVLCAGTVLRWQCGKWRKIRLVHK